MNRYNEFVRLSDQLRKAVSKMGTATSAKEVEQLQMTVRSSMKGLMMVVPFIEQEIGQYAMNNMKRASIASIKV